jgi:transposase-like protein
MKPEEREYAESERHAALELAASAGVSAAARELGLNRSTIYRWIDKYPKLWSDLKAGDRTAGRRRIADRLEDLADRYAANEHDLLERIEDGTISAKDAKEAAALLKAMGSGRIGAIAGVRSITNESESLEVNINFPAIEAAMERLLDSAAPPPALPVVNEAEADEPV